MKKPPSFWDLVAAVPREKRKGPSLLNLLTEPEPSGKALDSRGEPQGELRRQQSPCALCFNEDQVYWAMRNMPIEEAAKHFMICGVVGSGKTTAIDLFLQSIAPRFHPDRKQPEQLIIFDAKRDILPTLAGFGLRPGQDNVWILNPFDARCAVWNLADAAKAPAMARYIATLLVPPEPQSTSPFFASAARDLVVYVMWGLNRIRGSRWSLRDLLCALDSKEHIQGVTASHPRARRLVASILNDDKHAFGVISTLTTKLARFEEVAALWHDREAGPRFAIDQFLARPGVLVLGYDPVLNESLWPINAILLKALTDEILRGSNSRRPRHWFVLDEFRAMENVDCIHNLLNRGRSKGASVLIALQSTEGLIDIYKEHRAEDILSACAHKTFLRLGDPKTAGWAESYFGQTRRIEQVVSESFGGTSGHSTSIQYGLQDRPTLLASYFMNLPFSGPGKPHKAIHDVPWLECTLITERWFDQLNAWRRPPAEDVAAFVPHPDPESQKLKEWTPAEEILFGLKAPPKKPSGGARSKARRRPLPAPRRPPSPHLPGLAPEDTQP